MVKLILRQRLALLDTSPSSLNLSVTVVRTFVRTSGRAFFGLARKSDRKRHIPARENTSSGTEAAEASELGYEPGCVSTRSKQGYRNLKFHHCLNGIAQNSATAC